jgi:hypothetical protein
MPELPNKEITELLAKTRTDVHIYHDLMQFRVREILLVTTFYDAFILEQEGRLTEQIFGEYHNLKLTSAPRITNVTSGREAMKLIQERNFDLIILTLRISDTSPPELSSEIHKFKPELPILLLLHDNNDILRLGENRVFPDIDKVFVWNRSVNIFLAMISYIEDKRNVDNDTKLGLVRVILLVENSTRYYSRYLPVLYNEIIKQAQRLIEEEHLDEMKKVLRLNARPKILIAVNYEEALGIFEKYKNYLLCVISDVKFPKDGKSTENAGIELIKYVKSAMQDLPTLIQSSDPSNEKLAHRLKSHFINKNSELLATDLKGYIFNYLGFGDFIFRDIKGREIRRAHTMRELKNALREIPEQSLIYHASRNHFSAWLMARGEILIAKKIQPVKVTDFHKASELRKYLIEVFENIDEQYIRGKVIDYDESVLDRERLMIRLAEGSLGGKGRGLSFINTVIANLDLENRIKGAKIKIPRSAIIGTEAFDEFIQSNRLNKYIRSEYDIGKIRKKFISSQLPAALVAKLKVLLEYFKTPIAVRSSSLFEDSVSESFSGVYQTFLLPNNHHSPSERLKQLADAIRLVYASVYTREARQYFETIGYKIDEEKMGVIIQQIVGNDYDNVFYPHFSGVAESYNYYPISKMKPSEGIAVVGVGLGKYVIEGEKTYRFCPKYPKIELTDPETLVNNSQDFLYVINLEKRDVNLMEGEDSTLLKVNINDIVKHETLDEIAAVWDNHDHRLKPGLGHTGPLVINFNGILKYNTFPLSEILTNVLDIVQSSMGIPAEIEFAVDLNRENEREPVFYILQIKPFIRDTSSYNIDIKNIKRSELVLYTEKGMGNGIVDDIYDVIYVLPGKFDKGKTVEMTYELEKLNEGMRAENKKYILIGPGRWGTRDRWLGIPVVWTQISNAKIIVETDLKDFRVDASLGSHFFHNVTSMNIGYLTVHQNRSGDFVDWEWLNLQKPYNTTQYFSHIRLRKPLKILMDGRKGISVIFKSN